MTLDKLGSALSTIIKKITRASIIDEKFIKETVKDVQRALLQADVNVKLVFDLSKRIEKRAKKEKIPPGYSKRDHLIKIVYEELVNIVGRKTVPLNVKKGSKIMLVGLYGMGKTTTTVKLCKFLRRKGLSSGLICADVYRLGAFEQLSQLSSENNIPFYGDPEEKDPIKIINRGLEKLSKLDVLIVDTAGRHSLEKDLVNEMKEISNLLKPEEKLLVIDATIGQEAGEHAKSFHEAIGITGVILTKVDGSAKGGGALSAVAQTEAPIKFIGTGEKIDDFEEFDPNRFISRLLGMGDIKGLLERSKEIEVEEMKDFLKGKFTLKDMYSQLEAMNKMGPFKQLIQMIPGLSDFPKDMLQVTEERLKINKVIMDSMTEEELLRPEIINKQRMIRIARGSGTSVEDVKELLGAYNASKKVFKSLRKGRMPKLDQLAKMGIKLR